MNTLKIFNFGVSEVRTTEQNGEHFWAAKDVCDILEISKYRDAISQLADDERVSMKTDTLGGTQEMIFVNEPGLYRLIFKGRSESAKKFKRWVTHEVLPSIRREGVYRLERKNGELKDELIRSLNSTNSITKRALELSDELQKAGHRYRKSHTPVSPAERTEIRLLLGEGRGVGEVAGAVGRSSETVRRVKREMEISA